MKDWKECRIGDVVEVEQGLAINKKTNHLLVDKGLPLLRITDLINNTERQFIDENRVPKKFITKHSDIIYTRTGQVGFVFKGRIGVIHNNCFKVIPNSELDADYLYWFLKQKPMMEYAKSVASGSAQPDLNHDAFKSMPFSYPPLPTQRKIAAVLSAYDDLIENNTRRIAILEEMAQALYREWFVHFRFPGHEDVNTVESELGPVPEGWEVAKIGNLPIQIIDGDRSSRYPKRHELQKSGVLFLNTTNIKDNKLDLTNANFITQEKFAELRKGKLQPLDIIMTTRGSIGKVALFNCEYPTGFINAQMLIMRADGDVIDQFFLFQLLCDSEFQDAVQRFASGAAQPQIPIKDLSQIEIICPPIDIQRGFSQIVGEINELIKNFQTKNTTLRCTRDLLLPRLISGEVDVAGLDIMTDEGLP